MSVLPNPDSPLYISTHLSFSCLFPSLPRFHLLPFILLKWLVTTSTALIIWLKSCPPNLLSPHLIQVLAFLIHLPAFITGPPMLPGTQICFLFVVCPVLFPVYLQARFTYHSKPFFPHFRLTHLLRPSLHWYVQCRLVEWISWCCRPSTHTMGMLKKIFQYASIRKF